MSRKQEGNFITRDHRYIYPTGSLLALLTLALLRGGPNPYSFLKDNVPETLCAAACWVFLALSAAALLVKAARRDEYSRSFLKRPFMLRCGRYASYAAALAFVCAAADRLLLQLVHTVRLCARMEVNPQAFGPSMIYMTVKGWDILMTGIWTTVRLALFGTAIAFVLSVFMTFLRIQTPDRRDSDLVKFLKWIASRFARFYIFIIRGSPMMVQALIFYYFGFSLFKRTGLSVTEINNIWSFFISGLFTVSLNSTAYLAEVLRGGIQAVDPGQMEAARSLGMTNWQAMVRVVFPQAVKNSIPAIGNEFIINIKDSSVLSVIGVMDLMYATKSVSGIYYRSLEIYCVAAILYLILTYLSSLLLAWLGRKLDVPVRGIPSSN